jgi:hypothetical protein
MSLSQTEVLAAGWPRSAGKHCLSLSPSGQIEPWSCFPSSSGAATVIIPGDRVSRLLYEHFSNLSIGIPEAERVSLGSAFRALHEVSRALCELDLGADWMPLEGWEKASRLEELKNQGYDLKFEIWMAIGPVGELAKLVDECRYLCDAKPGAPAPAECLSYSTLPEAECLFEAKNIAPEWMRFLRGLRDRCLALDVESQTLPTEPSGVQHLLFHGYLVATLLHQALTILEFAELKSGGRTP